MRCPAPITTARLTLPPLGKTDHVAVLRVLSCPITTANVSWGQYTPEAASAWLLRRIEDEARHGFGMWGIGHGEELIGFCGFFAGTYDDLELSYVIYHEHQGQGFASEAAIAAVNSATNASLRILAMMNSSPRSGRRDSDDV